MTVVRASAVQTIPRAAFGSILFPFVPIHHTRDRLPLRSFRARHLHLT